MFIKVSLLRPFLLLILLWDFHCRSSIFFEAIAGMFCGTTFQTSRRVKFLSRVSMYIGQRPPHGARAFFDSQQNVRAKVVDLPQKECFCNRPPLAEGLPEDEEDRDGVFEPSFGKHFNFASVVLSRLCRLFF